MDYTGECVCVLRTPTIFATFFVSGRVREIDVAETTHYDLGRIFRFL